VVAFRSCFSHKQSLYFEVAMPKIRYIEKKMRADSLLVVKQANEIIAEYEKQGYDLTLRQLYYQFVSRDLLTNNQANYKRLGDIINDARLLGMIDWNSITDRTRGVESIDTWNSPDEIISACSKQFKIDLWETQKYRVEVWIEKEALAGVFERVCKEERVSYLSCRGYTSQSEMWRAAQRLMEYQDKDQQPVILHFGDHDPSGIDMSRDIKDRLALFGANVEFKRLALNKAQVDEYDPPPNPAKATDTRFEDYRSVYGDESWELDALDPTVLSDLVRKEIETLKDKVAWKIKVEEEEEHKRLLREVSDRWEELTEGL
jgi:hypothetical protein